MYKTTKTLTFIDNNKCDNYNNSQQKCSERNLFENIYSYTANIGSLTTNDLTTNNLSSHHASISTININHHFTDDITSIQNLSNTLVVGTHSTPDIISLSESHGLIVSNDMTIMGSIKSTDGKFTDDIYANNINLLGDLIATNMHCTNNFITNGQIFTSDITISNNLQTNGVVNSNEIVSNTLLSETISSNILETSEIVAPSNLKIMVPFGNSINIPNIKYSVVELNSPLIDPIAIKLYKIFIINSNVLLNADVTCDGIEIIIYNRNIKNKVIVRDTTYIVTTLESMQSGRFIYLDCIHKWIRN